MNESQSFCLMFWLRTSIFSPKSVENTVDNFDCFYVMLNGPRNKEKIVNKTNIIRLDAAQ